VGAQAGVDFRTEATPARVGELLATSLVASCEGGLQGELTLLPVEGACVAADYRWTQRSGPPLAASQLQGRTVLVQSVPGTPLSEVVGRPLVFDVTATGGEGNSETRTLTVDVASERLVEVEEHTQTPLAVEGQPLGLAVSLRNASNCALQGLSVHVRLRGLTPVADSARVDGQPVSSRWEEGVLVLEGLALPAGGAAELTLSATAGLYARPAAAAEVRLNGALVSRPAVLPEEEDTAEGCGCQGGGPGTAGLLSALLLVLARRRRPSGLTSRS
jgi:uncharacterized protein (TIGR03382 family)